MGCITDLLEGPTTVQVGGVTSNVSLFAPSLSALMIIRVLNYLQASQTSLHGVQKLPDELIVEVLRWDLSNDIPSRDLASVCKRWKALLSETSTFWRKVRASFVQEDKIAFHASRLRRRLELSQRALLDVTLDASGLRENTSQVLFEILGTVDVGRWRSLRLEAVGRLLPSDAISGYFNGSFTSLRHLYLEFVDREDPYWPIYDLIVHSPPSIKTLYTSRPIPTVLKTSAVLRRVVEITIPAQTYGEVHDKMAVETVHLTHSHYASATSLPRLPKNVIVDIISGETLSSLDLSAVQSLNLRYFMAHGDYNINLPSLISLVIPNNIHYIRGFIAPSLKSLVVGHDNLWGKEKIKESRNIITLFQKVPDEISMAPTSLEMFLSITTAASIAVLSHWKQLEHVHLEIYLDPARGERFAWDGGFIKAFKHFMCPNLLTLRLRTNWGDAESERWRQKAVELFKLRRSGPLELISWTSEASPKVPAFILTRGDHVKRREG